MAGNGDFQKNFFALSGFVTITAMYVAVTYTYWMLAIYQNVNILLPLQILICLGTFFTGGYCVTGFISNVDLKSKRTLIDLIFLGFTIAGVINDFFFVPQLTQHISLSLNMSLTASCMIGLVLGGIGLVSLIGKPLKEIIKTWHG